jgi:colanic acid/amylovoran biosynthesis glycosyltransferase
MQQQLILLTEGFPFGKTETFLETEILYLSKHFQHIHIIVINPESKILREVPSNCSIYIINHKENWHHKVSSLVYLFYPIFYKEIKIIKYTYKKKITYGIIKTMLMGIYRAKIIKQYIEEKFNLNVNNDLVFYSYWCDDSALGLSLLKTKYPSNKYISRIHRWDLYFEESKYNYISFRHYINCKLNLIVSISEDGVTYCRNKWLIPNPEKIMTHKLGIKKQILLPINNSIIIVSCSNLIPVKRVDLIVQSLSILTEYTFKWVHFGDGPEMQKIKKLSQNILNNNNVSWELKGNVKNSEIMKWYINDIPSLFINLSLSEGIPVSIMEAMSFGIPVIATDVGGTSEIVNNKNGYLISENASIEEVKSLICGYLTLTDYEKNLKKNAAYKTWENSYNAEINYTKFCNLITKL